MDRLLNKRYAALYPAVFVTYRRDTGAPSARLRGRQAASVFALLHPPHPPCNTWSADDSPSKVWPISHDTTVSDIKGQHYNLRHKNTFTLMAVARGALWDGAP